MKNWVRKYIKIYLALALYFSCIIGTYGQNKELSFYSNDNYWSVFVFDFMTNRYCYNYAKDAVTGTPLFSQGKTIMNGDTLIMISDYDNQKLPINVQCNEKKYSGGNEIYFNIIKNDSNPINDKAYNIERNRFLYVIINDNDTIKLNKDTIKYLKEISKFYIASYNSEISYFYYKTENFYNRTNCNNFNVVFNLNLEYAFFKPLNDTIIFKQSKAIWLMPNEKAVVKLKKTTLKKCKTILNNCECWDKIGVINIGAQ